MLALICFSFAVFVLGRLWALGRHLNEGARDAALLWWRPTPAQRTVHAIEAVIAQNRRVSVLRSPDIAQIWAMSCGL